jgi:hypothetical protein
MMMTAAGTVSGRARCSSWASASPACRRSPPRAGSARRCRRPTCAPPPRNRSNHSAPRRSSSRTSRASRAKALAAMPRKCRTNTRPRRRSWCPVHIAKQDIVITTALIPGRPAPRLITDAQIASMKPGSVIVDLAVEQGGNVEGAVAGEIVEKHGVKIVGHKTCLRASRLTPRLCFRATCSTSSPPSGTRRRMPRCSMRTIDETPSASPRTARS